jgi:hypothetical protein
MSLVNIDERKRFPRVTNTDSGENIYGPISYNENSDSENENRNPILAIELASAMYSSIAYIEFLNRLEKNIKPKVLVANGFTAIIAALYIKYQSSNRVSFKMFALLSRIKSIKPYSREWLEEINNFIDKEFLERKQEGYKTLLVIPSYNGSDIELIYTGLLASNLKSAVNLGERSTNFLLRPSSEYEKKLNKLGIDLHYKISVFGEKTIIQSESGFLLGVYSKIKGYSLLKRHRYKSLELNKLQIDKIENTIDISVEARKRSNAITHEIEQAIEDWKESKRSL